MHLDTASTADVNETHSNAASNAVNKTQPNTASTAVNEVQQPNNNIDFEGDDTVVLLILFSGQLVYYI
jgi:hypothetical protein